MYKPLTLFLTLLFLGSIVLSCEKDKTVSEPPINQPDTTFQNDNTPVVLTNYTQLMGGTNLMSGYRGLQPSSGPMTQYTVIDSSITFTVVNDSTLKIENVTLYIKHDYSESNIDTVNKVLYFRSSDSYYTAQVQYHYAIDSIWYDWRDYVGMGYNFLRVHN